MDPKKKNIIMISVAVLVIGYAGYSMLFSGGTKTTQTQSGQVVKKERKVVEGASDGKVIKKKAATKATKKKALVKKGGTERQKKTLKKRAGKRGNRKTKKAEISPAA